MNDDDVQIIGTNSVYLMKNPIDDNEHKTSQDGLSLLGVGQEVYSILHCFSQPVANV